MHLSYTHKGLYTSQACGSCRLVTCYAKTLYALHWCEQAALCSKTPMLVVLADVRVWRRGLLAAYKLCTGTRQGFLMRSTSMLQSA